MRKLILLLVPVTLTIADYAPVLSSTGKKRLLENISTIEKNISTVKTNILNCKKNVAVIEGEIKELTLLEQEHLQLKKKYEGQIAETSREIEKNDAAIKELENFQKNIAKNSANSSSDSQSAQQSDLARSQKDKMDREKWKNEANMKTEKITELVKKVNSNLLAIDSKKTPLKEQLGQWVAKEKEYQKLFVDLAAKKEESSKILKTQN